MSQESYNSYEEPELLDNTPELRNKRIEESPFFSKVKKFGKMASLLLFGSSAIANNSGQVNSESSYNENPDKTIEISIEDQALDSEQNAEEYQITASDFRESVSGDPIISFQKTLDSLKTLELQQGLEMVGLEFKAGDAKEKLIKLEDDLAKAQRKARPSKGDGLSPSEQKVEDLQQQVDSLRADVEKYEQAKQKHDTTSKQIEFLQNKINEAKASGSEPSEEDIREQQKIEKEHQLALQKIRNQGEIDAVTNETRNENEVEDLQGKADVANAENNVLDAGRAGIDIQTLSDEEYKEIRKRARAKQEMDEYGNVQKEYRRDMSEAKLYEALEKAIADDDEKKIDYYMDKIKETSGYLGIMRKLAETNPRYLKKLEKAEKDAAKNQQAQLQLNREAYSVNGGYGQSIWSKDNIPSRVTSAPRIIEEIGPIERDTSYEISFELKSYDYEKVFAEQVYDNSWDENGEYSFGAMHLGWKKGHENYRYDIDQAGEAISFVQNEVMIKNKPFLQGSFNSMLQMVDKMGPEQQKAISGITWENGGEQYIRNLFTGTQDQVLQNLNKHCMTLLTENPGNIYGTSETDGVRIETFSRKGVKGTVFIALIPQPLSKALTSLDKIPMDSEGIPFGRTVSQLSCGGNLGPASFARSVIQKNKEIITNNQKVTKKETITETEFVQYAQQQQQPIIFYNTVQEASQPYVTGRFNMQTHALISFQRRRGRQYGWVNRGMYNNYCRDRNIQPLPVIYEQGTSHTRGHVPSGWNYETGSSGSNGNSGATIPGSGGTSGKKG